MKEIPSDDDSIEYKKWSQIGVMDDEGILGEYCHNKW